MQQIFLARLVGLRESKAIETITKAKLKAHLIQKGGTPFTTIVNDTVVLYIDEHHFVSTANAGNPAEVEK